jgi:uncharacterized protein (TIGR03067 family)
MPVLPIRVEDVRPEGAMECALGNTHWLDAFTPPVEKQLELLARSVKTLLGQDVAATPRGPTAMPTARGNPEHVVPAAGPAPSPRYRMRLAVGLAVMLTVMIVAGSLVMFRGDRTVPTVPPIPKTAPLSDQERIQGRWQMVEQTNSQKKATTAAVVWVFSGTHLTMYRSVDHDVRAAEFRGPFSLSTGVERMLFDFSSNTTEGKPIEALGIYEFEGEFFKVCYSVRMDHAPDVKRPDSFVLTEGAGLRHYLKFKRLGR